MAWVRPHAFIWRREQLICECFEGLYGLVRDCLLCEPLRGHIFVFANAGRNRLKLLFWDGSGLWVCVKRLEKGRFCWPEANSGATKVKLSHEELTLLLGGIDLTQTRRRGWHRLEELLRLARIAKYGPASEKLNST